MARCVWRINWLGGWFDKGREGRWVIGCLMAAMAGLIVVLALAIPAPGPKPSPSLSGIFLESYFSGFPGGGGVWGWGGLTASGAFVAAAGLALRLRWAAMGLWKVARVEDASWSGSFLAWLWAPATVTALSSCKAIEWIFERLRSEGAKGRSAPIQALMGLLGLGATTLVLLDILALALSMLLGAMYTGMGLYWASQGRLPADHFNAAALLTGALALMMWIRQGSVAAAGRGLAGWARKAAGLARAGAQAPIRNGKALSGWAQAKEGWRQGLIERAARDGALSQAERDSLEAELPRAAAGTGDGVKRL